MKKKNIYLIFFILLCNLFIVECVFGIITSITLVAPADGKNLTGLNYLLNATYIGNSSGYITFYANSTILCNITNVTTANSSASCLWNTTDISDSGAYVFNATAYNSTGGMEATNLSTFVGVDNTEPSLSYESPSPANGANVSGTMIINVSASDATLEVDTILIYLDGSINQTCTSSPCSSTINTTTLADGSHNFTAVANDTLGNTNSSLAIRVITVENNPSVSFNTPSSGSWHNADFVLNVTVTGSPITVNYRLENASDSSVVIGWTNMSNPSGNNWNATVDVSAVDNWNNYTIRINATGALGNSNDTETIIIGIDDVPPYNVSVSCNTITAGDSRSCSCSADDNSESFVGTLSYSYLGDDTSSAGTTTVTCTATDLAGNTNSSTTSYTVEAAPTTSSGGGGGGDASSVETYSIFEVSASKMWDVVEIGVPVVMAVSKEEIPVLSITFEVINEVKNVEVWVGEPKEVPEAALLLTTPVYKHLQIDKTNIANGDIKSIEIEFRVEKSWLSENGISGDNVIFVKYDDGWLELDTDKISSDDDYVYYEATTPGLSYFVITTKTAVETQVAAEEVVEESEAAPVEEEVPEEAPVEEEVLPAEEAPPKKKPWLGWIITLVIVVVAVLGYSIYEQRSKF
ncbi:PGF-pre-PGF domain-containing protein [Candidatus Woesearchaeota archaeon]|nr:PGF-pre-PGF domain-containing protein [Candidatus Woesearchaeota archaeon]